MVQISVSEQVAEKLTRMAERQHASVNEILADLLDIERNDNESDAEPGSGATFLKYALAADIHAGDLAGNSREMLEKRFPR